MAKVKAPRANTVAAILAEIPVINGSTPIVRHRITKAVMVFFIVICFVSSPQEGSNFELGGVIRS